MIVGHPFDLVKVRMQTAEKGVYNGAIDVVRKTVAREGATVLQIVKREKRSKVHQPWLNLRWSVPHPVQGDFLRDLP